MKRLLFVLALGVLCFSSRAENINITPSGGGGGAGVSSLAGACQVTANPATGAVTASLQFLPSPNVATIAMGTYTLVATDLCTDVTLASGYTGGVTIPGVATPGFGNGAFGRINNQSGTTQTITVANNIDTLASFALPSGLSFGFHSDGSTYHFTDGGQNIVTLAAAQTLTNKSIDAGQLTGTVAPARLAQRTTSSNADVNVTCTATQLVAFTAIAAPHVVNFPAASACTAGQRLIIVDESGSVSPANTISVVPNGGDNIQGSSVTWVACATARCFVEFETDAVSNWYVVRRSADEQFFTANGTFSRVVGITDYDAFGCGQGGGGGGGTAANATGSGGAGGGGADCHLTSFKAADMVAAGGTLSVTFTTNTNGGAVNTAGTQGGNTVLGAGPLETWFGGGGGAAGNASTSTGGTGASPWQQGFNANNSAPSGCANTGAGGAGAVGGGDGIGCGGGGGGSGATGNVARGGYGSIAYFSAPGGSSGGGVNASAGVSAAGATGGKSIGCQTAPSGGALNTNGGGPTPAQFPYLPGCGGAGGGGATNNTAGSGTAGTNGGGGGGGGSANSGGTTPVAGTGGNGGAGFLIIRGR